MNTCSENEDFYDLEDLIQEVQQFEQEQANLQESDSDKYDSDSEEIEDFTIVNKCLKKLINHTNKNRRFTKQIIIEPCEKNSYQHVRDSVKIKNK